MRGLQDKRRSLPSEYQSLNHLGAEGEIKWILSNSLMEAGDREEEKADVKRPSEYKEGLQ